MGKGYGFACTNCGYKKDLMEGQGFVIRNWSVKEYLEDTHFNFHYKTHRKIEQLAEKYDSLLINIHSEYRIMVCPHCNIPYSRLYVVVIDHQQIHHCSDFRCSRCNKRLEEKEVGLMETFRCPKCVQETLKSDGSFINWD